MMSLVAIPSSLIRRLRATRRLVVLTGAGVSAESGIPTFREAQTGLWARYDPQELATAAAFRRNPRLVWNWYQWRRSLVASAAPNQGHIALARLQTLVPRLTLVTQNVDGLHQDAGSEHIVELHGNLRRNKCFRNHHPVPPGEEIAAEDAEDPPRCPTCNSLLRPDVVWFGESLPEDAVATAFSAAQACELFLAIGTSAIVHPAASLPFIAREAGAIIIEINLNETALTPHADYALHAASGEILPRLVNDGWPAAAAPD